MNNLVLPITFSFSRQHTLEIIRGDLTAETTDAIVNAANSQLQHGGGIAGFIVSKGGNIIQEESDQWIAEYGQVSHTKPAYTNSGSLPCKKIIHAVGPVWGSGNEDEKLHKAIIGSLELAEELNLKSISFPAISTGIFGFPKERAATIFFKAFQQYFIETEPKSNIHLVKLVLFGQPGIDAFLKSYNEWLQSIN
ncbi:MAG: macro domain-containing protein [Anaerolineaceae bacterium]|nr:macro domain-containing protein [Anaerolineaceae bacterium]